jgi:serine phosphatase RsbU (regulator of sigma subunit)
MRSAIKKKINRLKSFFRWYTTGLSRREIERLLKKDTHEAFEFYREKIPHREQRAPGPAGSVKTAIGVFKQVFMSFLMQLTPARRFFYGLSLIGFLSGFIWSHQLLVIGAFVVLNLLLALELANKLITRDELEIAREIQVSLQPQRLPDFPGLSIASFSQPARIVGGDFFNIVKRNGNQLMSIVGDVAGKGMPAALYAAHIQSMFESLSEKSASPADIMRGLNKLICRRLREGDFITAVIAFFEPGRNAVTIARAGHNWPLHYKAQNQSIDSLNPPGICLGIDTGRGFSACLREKTVAVERGDVLLLYSDGITEAVNSSSKLFELSRLKSALKETAHFPAPKIITGIHQRLDEFVDAEELHDDMTMVAIKMH